MIIILTSILVVLAVALVIGLTVAITTVLIQNNNQDLGAAEVQKLLAGYNCGGCGYPSCAIFAKAVADKKEPPEKCRPNSKQNLAALKELLKEKK